MSGDQDGGSQFECFFVCLFTPLLKKFPQRLFRHPKKTMATLKKIFHELLKSLSVADVVSALEEGKK